MQLCAAKIAARQKPVILYKTFRFMQTLSHIPKYAKNLGKIYNI